MRYIKEFIELEKTDDRDDNASRPKLAARALMELSLLNGDEPVRLKKKKPVFEHRVRSKNHAVARVGDHFPIQVRQQIELEAPYENPSFYVLRVASMTIRTALGVCVYEFSEGETSISNGKNSSTKTESGLWAVSNNWRPVDHSVREYLRLQHDSLQEYGI